MRTVFISGLMLTVLLSSASYASSLTKDECAELIRNSLLVAQATKEINDQAIVVLLSSVLVSELEKAAPKELAQSPKLSDTMSESGRRIGSVVKDKLTIFTKQQDSLTQKLCGQFFESQSRSP